MLQPSWSSPGAATFLDTVTTRDEARGLQLALRASAIVFVTMLTAIAAQISIPLPFTPVPFTLQPMIVLLGGAALGARLGMTSQVLYLALASRVFPCSRRRRRSRPAWRGCSVR